MIAEKNGFVPASTSPVLRHGHPGNDDAGVGAESAQSSMEIAFFGQDRTASISLSRSSSGGFSSRT